MMPGPIPWTARHRYERAHGVINRERFGYLIRRMDREYMAAALKKGEKPKAGEG